MMRTLNATLVCMLLVFQWACVTTESDPVEISLDEAAKANLQLGANYLQKGDLAMAREKLEKAVKQDPKLASARTYIAILYERLGEADLAEENYREAVRLAPNDPDVANTYGGYLCRNDKRRDGIKYFQSAAKNPLYRTPEVAYTNAAVCALGIPDPTLAETFLRQAVAANPRYREALLRLAMLSYDTDRPLQARAFLQRFHEGGLATPDSLSLGIRVETALGNQAAANEYRERLRVEFPDQAAPPE